MDGQAQKSLQIKLSVWSIFREAIEFSWEHRHALWRWIVLGAVLAGLSEVVSLYEFQDKKDGLWPLLYISIAFLAVIASFTVFVFLAVYCHRTFLLGSSQETKSLRFSCAKRGVKYVEWSLKLMIFFLVWYLFSAIGMEIFSDWNSLGEMINKNSWEFTPLGWGILYSTCILPIYYVWGRATLIFPAIALDQDPKLDWSWKQTKGNGWRMFLLVGLIPLTVGNLQNLMPFIGLSEFSLFNSFFTAFTLFVLTPVEVVVISIAFRELTNWTPSTQLSEST